MKNLILFSLGPVQSFISQARKTHDLWAGSQLLSDLVRAAMDVFKDDEKIVFPSPTSPALPNRFVAWVPENELDMQVFGEKVETAVRSEWLKIAENYLDISSPPKGFKEQIESHLEIFWVIEPEVKDYREAVGNLEKNLAAIKNVRPFSQYNYLAGEIGELGRKCSLDGQRNALFARLRLDKQGIKSKPANLSQHAITISEHLLREGEAISAVSLVKRKYQPKGTQRKEFDSTAEIALLSTLCEIEKELPNTKTCIALLRRINAQLFYEEAVSNATTLLKYLRDAGVSEDSAESISKCSIEVRAAAAKLNLQMSKYYAILSFDGDNMGKWLEGEEGWLKPEKDLQNFHKELAKHLGKFAADAKAFIDAGHGQTAYAGGDDFLGFINLNYLLPVLKTLRSMFRENVNDELKEWIETEKEITFSAGICVAHYKEPLSLVLENARESQKAAKNAGRDAFGISVLKGSGETHLTILPFGEYEINVERLNKLISQLIQEDFSNTFIKALRLEFDRLPSPGPILPLANFEQIFRVELNRLLGRATCNSWPVEKKKQEALKLTDQLMPLHANKPDNFFQMLHIADFFHRNMDGIKIQSSPQTV